MPSWPKDWDACSRLAWLSCDCCGKDAHRHVPSSFTTGRDTGLPCGELGCRLCAGPCRSTLVVVDTDPASAAGATGSHAIPACGLEPKSSSDPSQHGAAGAT